MASTSTRIYEGLQFANNDRKLTYFTNRLAKMLAEKTIFKDM